MHQLEREARTNQLVARVTFSNRWYSDNDYQRRDEDFDFHFPSLRAHLWSFGERDFADPCASCGPSLNLHHNFAAQFLRCGDNLGWLTRAR